MGKDGTLWEHESNDCPFYLSFQSRAEEQDCIQASAGVKTLWKYDKITEGDFLANYWQLLKLFSKLIYISVPFP